MNLFSFLNVFKLPYFSYIHLNFINFHRSLCFVIVTCVVIWNLMNFNTVNTHKKILISLIKIIFFFVSLIFILENVLIKEQMEERSASSSVSSPTLEDILDSLLALRRPNKKFRSKQGGKGMTKNQITLAILPKKNEKSKLKNFHRT